MARVCERLVNQEERGGGEVVRAHRAMEWRMREGPREVIILKRPSCRR